jgi:hypothetical protein
MKKYKNKGTQRSNSKEPKTYCDSTMSVRFNEPANKTIGSAERMKGISNAII